MFFTDYMGNKKSKKMKNPHTYHKKYCDKDVTFPRDNRFLNQTFDYLFIAELLLNWKDGVKFLDLYKDDNRNHFYLYAGNDGKKYTVISGKEFDVSNLHYKCSLKKSAVYRGFRKTFFDIRNFVTSKNTDCSLKIDNTLIYDEGKIIDKGWNKIDSKLKWKLGYDLNLNFHKHVVKDKSFKIKYDAICPVCGKVNLVSAVHSSPEWTWMKLCGREYAFLLCPKCLGVFASEMTAMS